MKKLSEFLGGSRILTIAVVNSFPLQKTEETHIISDLMITDLAFIEALIGSEFETAIVNKEKEYGWNCHAVVEMKYFNGTIVRLEAKHFAAEAVHWIRIIDEHQNIYKLDFITGSLLQNNQVLSKAKTLFKAPKINKEVLDLCKELEAASQQ